MRAATVDAKDSDAVAIPHFIQNCKIVLADVPMPLIPWDNHAT